MTGGLGLAGAGALGGLGYRELDPENLQSDLAKGGLGVAGLLALRYGVSPALRSSSLSNLMINKALGMAGSITRQSPGGCSEFLRRPLLIVRKKPEVKHTAR